jgi:hypothetical protein
MESSLNVWETGRRTGFISKSYGLFIEIFINVESVKSILQINKFQAISRLHTCAGIMSAQAGCLRFSERIQEKYNHPD